MSSPIPTLLSTSTSSTRYELYRLFDMVGGQSQWKLWHQSKAHDRILKLRKQYVDRGVDPNELCMIVVSEQRRIIPSPPPAKDIPDVPRKSPPSAACHYPAATD